MSNTLGKALTFTLFGESHGPCVGGVLDGLPAGIKIDEDYINECLSKRRPRGKETARVEKDNYTFLSGVYNGYTTGDSLCFTIENANTRSKDYDNLKMVPRPGHADYTVYTKADGFNDPRGGGHTSGRLTAAIVLAGAIVRKQLEQKGISIGTHISEIGGLKDSLYSKEITKEIEAINKKDMPVLSLDEEKITNLITEAANNQDSIGGVIETGITGLPVGLGNPWFDSFEGAIANASFSIGGVKGIEFGDGFGFKDLMGSTANDAFCYEEEKIVTKTNHNGGINGGITNGMPVVFKCAIKPTPSISKEQDSVDLNTKENVKLEIHGRHDAAIIRRICIVITSITALVVADMLTQEYGRKALK